MRLLVVSGRTNTNGPILTFPRARGKEFQLRGISGQLKAFPGALRTEFLEAPGVCVGKPHFPSLGRGRARVGGLPVREGRNLWLLGTWNR